MIDRHVITKGCRCYRRCGRVGNCARHLRRPSQTVVAEVWRMSLAPIEVTGERRTRFAGEQMPARGYRMSQRRKARTQAVRGVDHYTCEPLRKQGGCYFKHQTNPKQRKN